MQFGAPVLVLDDGPGSRSRRFRRFVHHARPLTSPSLVAAVAASGAWGVRAHTWINRVAVRTLPDDGPVFLKAHEDWIAYLSVIPDAWRRPSEPFLKMLEDPNHGWFKEQFAFMTEIPRSRYEFVLKLYDEQRRLAAEGDPAAALTNVRWTGTMAYAAVEGYERMLTGMRRYRELQARNEDTRFVELEIAFYMGWTGHYTGDGAQPLHDTVHHDGWQGANPKGYTTNPRVHGLFETQFVDAMKLEGGDFQPKVAAGARARGSVHRDPRAPRRSGPPHRAGLSALEKSGALADRQQCRGAGAGDSAGRAWRGAAARPGAHGVGRSGEPPVNDPGGNPIVPAHPRYNPATGSAPAHPPTAAPRSPQGAQRWQPMTHADPLTGKNFYLFEAIGRSAEASRAIGTAADLMRSATRGWPNYRKPLTPAAAIRAVMPRRFAGVRATSRRPNEGCAPWPGTTEPLRR